MNNLQGGDRVVNTARPSCLPMSFSRQRPCASETEHGVASCILPTLPAGQERQRRPHLKSVQIRVVEHAAPTKLPL